MITPDLHQEYISADLEMYQYSVNDCKITT